jgi:hypothetical protein
MFAAHLRTARRFGTHAVLFAASAEQFEELAAVPAAERRIDIWYEAGSTGSLMLLLAYLITRDDAWDGAGRRLLLFRPADLATEEAEEMLRGKLAESRIEAEVVVVDDQASAAALQEASRSASLVLLPFVLTADGPVSTWRLPLDALITGLPVTGMVAAGRELDLGAEPEHGEHGERAKRSDRAADLEAIAKRAEEEAEAAREEVVAVRKELAGSVDPEQVDELADRLLEAQERARRMHRRAARCRAKAHAAAQEGGRIAEPK